MENSCVFAQVVASDSFLPTNFELLYNPEKKKGERVIWTYNKYFFKSFLSVIMGTIIIIVLHICYWNNICPTCSKTDSKRGVI